MSKEPFVTGPANYDHPLWAAEPKAGQKTKNETKPGSHFLRSLFCFCSSKAAKTGSNTEEVRWPLLSSQTVYTSAEQPLSPPTHPSFPPVKPRPARQVQYCRPATAVVGMEPASYHQAAPAGGHPPQPPIANNTQTPARHHTASHSQVSRPGGHPPAIQATIIHATRKPVAGQTGQPAPAWTEAVRPVQQQPSSSSSSSSSSNSSGTPTPAAGARTRYVPYRAATAQPPTPPTPPSSSPPRWARHGSDNGQRPRQPPPINPPSPPSPSSAWSGPPSDYEVSPVSDADVDVDVNVDVTASSGGGGYGRRRG